MKRKPLAKALYGAELRARHKTWNRIHVPLWTAVDQCTAMQVQWRLHNQLGWRRWLNGA